MRSSYRWGAPSRTQEEGLAGERAAIADLKERAELVTDDTLSRLEARVLAVGVQAHVGHTPACNQIRTGEKRLLPHVQAYACEFKPRCLRLSGGASRVKARPLAAARGRRIRWRIDGRYSSAAVPEAHQAPTMMHRPTDTQPEMGRSIKGLESNAFCERWERASRCVAGRKKVSCPGRGRS